MDVTQLESLFSISAGEAKPENDWTEQFLADWVSFGSSAGNINCREVITWEERSRWFYNLPASLQEEQDFSVLNLVPQCYKLYAFYLYAPMKLTTSGRSKLTTIFAGEGKRFMHV